MANYLYNGVELPALPTEDESFYEYNYIGKVAVTFFFPELEGTPYASIPIYALHSSARELDGIPPYQLDGVDYPGLIQASTSATNAYCWFLLTKSAELVQIAGDPDLKLNTWYHYGGVSGIHARYELSFTPGDLIDGWQWADYNIANPIYAAAPDPTFWPSELYLAASEPVPVPGDTPALYGLHVPSFLQGVEVGRRLKNKRQPPNPYLFDYYRYVVSLNEEYLADLIKDYTNITNYSWQLDSKVEKVLSVPVSFKPIWGNVDFLDETEEAIFIEGSEPIYVPIKKFSLQEFLEGLIEGMLEQPFPLYKKYHGKFPEIPSQNYNTFPYLTLVKIDDSESTVKIKLKDGSYKTVKAALLASEKPLVVDANNIILKEGCNIEKAYTDYYNFYIRENEKWFQFYYSTDSVVTNKYNLIWSNYDIFDKNGALFIEGVSTPPHII